MIAEASNLEVLRLSTGSNLISGTVPSCFNKLKNLVSVSLRATRLSGTIASETFNTMEHLLSLILDRNRITGHLNFLPRSLETLNLAGNRMSSGLSFCSSERLPRLTYIDVSNNSFTGPLPVFGNQVAHSLTPANLPLRCVSSSSSSSSFFIFSYD